MSTDYRIVRWVVPADDAVHEFPLSGAVLHVDSRSADYVELWTLDTGGPTLNRGFIVVGTGHPFPDEWTHRGSVIVAGGALVWHLMEVPRG